MVDLAALARQMKAIGRKGSGKDYYEQYVAQGIENGAARAKRAPAPDDRVSLPDWLVNYGVPLRPRSAPAARRTDGRRVRDDPVYHKTGVLYAQYDGGALQKPRVVQQASVASTATPADSVAKWPTRWWHGASGRFTAATDCAQLMPCAVHTAHDASVLAAMLCGIS